MTDQPTSGFDLNRPTIIGLLFLAAYITGITAIIAVVLCYVWRDGAEEWERAHFTYLANTFWIGLVGSVIGFVLLIVLIGFPILLAIGVLCLVRVIMSLVSAQKRAPMPNPGTLFV